MKQLLYLVSYYLGDSGSPLLNDEKSPATLETITTQIGVLHGGFIACEDKDYPGIYSLLTEPNINKWLIDILTGDYIFKIFHKFIYRICTIIDYGCFGFHLYGHGQNVIFRI